MQSFGSAIRRFMVALLLGALSLPLASCGGPTYDVLHYDAGVMGPNATGAQCTAASDCSGVSPVCAQQLLPLAPYSTDVALQQLTVDLPGGYCTSSASCLSVASCGHGGACFAPLAGLDSVGLSNLQSAHPEISVAKLAGLGICLDPCRTNANCRTSEGYVCARPLEAFLASIPGAASTTYCIGKSTVTGCGTCDPHATCNATTSLCECNTGYVGDGNRCDPDPLTTCTLAYDLPSTNGPAMHVESLIGATTVSIGPGRLVVRVPRDPVSGHPVDGQAEIIFLEFDQYFGPVSGVLTQTRVCLLDPEATVPSIGIAAEPPEQSAVPECLRPTNTTAMATGTFTTIAAGGGNLSFPCYSPNPSDIGYTPDMATGTAPGCLRRWFTYGRIFCSAGQTCSLALPEDTWLDRSGTWSQHLLDPVVLGANFATLTMGDRNGGSMTDAWAHTPSTDPAWTGFTLQGTLDVAGSTCVIP